MHAAELQVPGHACGLILVFFILVLIVLCSFSSDRVYLESWVFDEFL
jgi:hypothetical protein